MTAEWHSTVGEAGRNPAAGPPAWVRRSWRALRRPRVTDCLVTALVLFLSMTSSVKNPLLGPAGEPWINHLLAAVIPLTLLVRRRLPEVPALVSLVSYQLHVGIFLSVFAFYALGAHRGSRNRTLTWGTTLVGLLLLAPWERLPHLTLGALAQWLLFEFPLQVLLPLVIGLYAGARRAVMAALVERAERAEREQLLIAEAARVEERTRIAGEMHDVVSHQVSLMVVHANALEAVAHDPDTTAKAAATIRTAGRQALNELREMIGVLRSDPGEQPATGLRAAEQNRGEAASSGAPVEAPDTPQQQPTLDEIAALVGSSRSAGLPAVLHVEGEPRSLPDPAERAVYRVVQEALTNVHKHAAGANTEVRLAYGSQQLSVTVSNSCPAPSTSRKAAEPLLPSGGHGLIGLGERVRLAGGTSEYGPRSDGGFLVSATLPAQC